MSTCRVCGCTDAEGCPPGGCYWVTPTRCSACWELLDGVTRTSDYDVEGKAGKRAMLRGAEIAIRLYRRRLVVYPREPIT